MIGIRAFDQLKAQRQQDAKVLFKGDRYNAAVYLMGYALEYALKKKICLFLGFDLGFPELNSEFRNYSSQLAEFNSRNYGVQLNHLRQIKSHNLEDLLSFSGIDSKIQNEYCEHWNIIKDWTPEDRYRIRRCT
jgi:hypothetical protein